MGSSTSKSIATDDVPVIDIGPLHDGTDPEAVARRLGWAATEIGFIYVRNHGISSHLVDRARGAALQFFGLPLEKKLEVSTNAYHHGYLRPGQTKMYDDARVDLKESFNWGYELSDAELAEVGGNPLLGPNRWPDVLPGLRQAVYPYFEVAQACALDILRAFAIALGLPPHSFVEHSDRPISRGSLQYYPSPPVEVGEEQFGVAPHSDFGVLTVLCQDAVGGLEIQDLDGQWLAVPPIDGTLVINVGDLLERWTNGHFRSTPHRVINKSGRVRLSLVLAYDPNFETLVDPRIVCQEGEAPRYEPISCGEYLVWRFRKAFSYRQ